MSAGTAVSQTSAATRRLPSLAQRFLDLATEVLNDARAEIIGTRGDEIVAAFESPRAALRASITLQRRFLAQTEADPDVPLPVGIGLDMGEVVAVSDGYRGNAINVAARLCSIAPAGAILATREVVHVAQALDGMRYEARRPVRLKGISESVQHVAVVDTARDTAAAFVRLGRSQAAKQPSHRRLSAGRRVALALTCLALVPPIVYAALTLGGGAPSAVVVASEGLTTLSPSGKVLKSVTLGGNPTGVVGAFGSEWVTSSTTDQLFRVDWRTQSVTEITVGSQPEGVAVGFGAVWVANSSDGTVDRVSPVNNTVVDVIDVGTGPQFVSACDSAVWVSDTLAASITEIDPRDNSVERTDSTGPEPAGIACGDGTLWVANEGNGTVQRLDPRNGEQLSGPVSVGNGPTAVAYGDGATWVTNSLDGTISRIDAVDDEITTAPAGAGADGVTVARQNVWVVNEDANTLSEFSAAGSRLRTVTLQSAPRGVAFANGRLWVVSDGLGSRAHRGGLLVVDSAPLYGDGSIHPGSIDPASAYTSSLWRILIMTNDGLVGFRRVGGLQGANLVPDLATFIPAPTDGGLTYTFRVRRGVRFSDGQQVLASDFLFALVRDVKVESLPETPQPADFDLIPYLLGGPSCSLHPDTCSLARAVQADNSTGEVAFHLRKPDPDFLYQLALPFADPLPPTTSVRLPSGGTVPATGPYRILSYRPAPGPRLGRVVLVRNPYFRQWSAAAQPEGFPDRIVINTGLALSSEVGAVESGSADALWDSPSPAQYTTMKTDYPTQVYTNTVDATSYLFLNTRLKPFNSLAVRRAVSFAFDRSAAVTGQVDSPAGGRLTCQVLPSAFPSYRPYCPYTLDPGRRTWTAPDLASAQELIARSALKGTHVTVVASPVFGTTAAEVLVKTLDGLGFPARLKEVSNNDYFSEVDDSSNHVQAGFQNWQADYVSPAQFFEPLLTCSSFQPGSANFNDAEFCDPAIDKSISRAEAAEEANSGTAVSDWAAVDHAVVDEAPWIPLANPEVIDFVSRRVGDYQYNPQFGELTDLLWVQ